MPTTRALPDDVALRETVDLFAAMAHPARLAVLVALGRQGPMSSGDLAALVGVEQSAMSHQLRVLRNARLVSTQRAGKRIIYALSDHHVAHIVEDAVHHATEDHHPSEPDPCATSTR